MLTRYPRDHTVAMQTTFHVTNHRRETNCNLFPLQPLQRGSLRAATLAASSWLSPQTEMLSGPKGQGSTKSKGVKPKTWRKNTENNCCQVINIFILSWVAPCRHTDAVRSLSFLLQQSSSSWSEDSPDHTWLAGLETHIPVLLTRPPQVHHWGFTFRFVQH